MTNKRNSLGKRGALIATITVLIGIALCFEWKLISSLLRLREMRIPYIAFVLALIPAALAVRATRGRWPLWKCAGYGAIAGQVAATTSLTLANLFIRNGIKRNLETLRRDGLAELLLIDSTVAFVLGGWLIGALAFMLYELLSRRYITAESRS